MFWIGNKCTIVFPLSTCLSVVLDNKSFIYLHFTGIYSGPGTELGIDQFSDWELPIYQRKLALYSLYCPYFIRERNSDILDTEEIIKVLEETSVNLLNAQIL